MTQLTNKQLALKINPNLKAQKNHDGSWTVWNGNEALVQCFYVQEAWKKAYLQGW